MSVFIEARLLLLLDLFKLFGSEQADDLLGHLDTDIRRR